MFFFIFNWSLIQIITTIDSRNHSFSVRQLFINNILEFAIFMSRAIDIATFFLNKSIKSNDSFSIRRSLSSTRSTVLWTFFIIENRKYLSWTIFCRERRNFSRLKHNSEFWLEKWKHSIRQSSQSQKLSKKSSWMRRSIRLYQKQRSFSLKRARKSWKRIRSAK